MNEMRLKNLIYNRHKGETAVLIANGPSLNSTNFDLIKDKICFGLNKIFLGFKKFDFYPKYYVAVNEKVLRQSSENIKELNCVKFLSNRADDIFTENALTYILNTKAPKERFSSAIHAGLEEGWTVTYAALQVAFYMGFSKVVIVGMDHSFVYQGKPNEASVLQGEDPNHFCGDYFGGGQSWDNPDLLRSEESYSIARDMFEKNGREILDATVGGVCNIFKKTTLEAEFAAQGNCRNVES